MPANSSHWRRTNGLLKQLEGLQGRGRLVAHGRQLRGVSRIEGVEERVGQRAEDKAIHAAPPRARAAPVKLAVVEHGRDMHAGTQHKLLDRRTSHRAIELAGNSEDRVVNALGVEPAAVLPPEPLVLAVDRGE